LTVGVFGLEAVGARAATPSSLAGEVIFGPISVTGNCTDVSNGSFTFSVTGTATGPYPGTFTESGRGTVTNAVLSAFSARFSIASSAGSVRGSMSLASLAGPTLCTPIHIFFLSNPNVNYAATINGAYRDTGAGFVNDFPQDFPPFLGEGFVNSSGVVPLQNDNGQGNNNNQGT
jgi:hypothetical protein